MYLSKIQLNALIELKMRGSCDAAPELVEYFLQEGLLATDLAGYLVTEKGQASIRDTIDEQNRIAHENRATSFAEWERNNRT